MEIIVSQKYDMVDLALIAEKAKEYIANAKSLRTREIYRIGWRILMTGAFQGIKPFGS